MRSKKCPVCGKEFVLAPYSIYKITVKGKVIYTCGWNCLRTLEKEKAEKKLLKEENTDADR